MTDPETQWIFLVWMGRGRGWSRGRGGGRGGSLTAWLLGLSVNICSFLIPVLYSFLGVVWGCTPVTHVPLCLEPPCRL